MKMPRIVKNSINKSHDTVELYQDVAGDWRWRYVAFENSKILGVSSEGYRNYADAEWAARRVTTRRFRKIKFVRKLDG